MMMVMIMIAISPVNIPGPIWKRFGCGHLRPLRPPFSQNRAGSYMPTSHIRFGSVLPKEARIIFCKTGPDLMWWPGQVLAKRIWSGSKPMCRNHRARFWQNITGPLPVPHFETRLRSSTDGPDYIVPNQPGSDLVLAHTHSVRFWPRKRAGVQESSGQRFRCESAPACLLGLY